MTWGHGAGGGPRIGQLREQRCWTNSGGDKEAGSVTLTIKGAPLGPRPALRSMNLASRPSTHVRQGQTLPLEQTAPRVKS